MVTLDKKTDSFDLLAVLIEESKPERRAYAEKVLAEARRIAQAVRENSNVDPEKMKIPVGQ